MELREQDEVWGKAGVGLRRWETFPGVLALRDTSMEGEDWRRGKG